MRGKKIRSEGIKTFGETYSISTELHLIIKGYLF
jgi:hypothetical protein